MTEPANQAEFREPLLSQTLKAAMGYRGAADRRVGGIFNPAREKLPVGEVIVRLGNRSRLLADDRNGAWWMRESTLFLNAEGVADVDALVGRLRQNLAVPPDFSPMDRLFRASLQQRLLAFAGVGTGVFKFPDPSRSRPGDRVDPYLAGTEMDGSAHGKSLRYQLFIPGLADCGRTALAFDPVRTLRDWFGVARFLRH